MKVLVNFIQDRSGSTRKVWPEYLSGFKSFVETLKGNTDGTEYLFTLTTFDTLIEWPALHKPIDEITGDELTKCGPRGSTALYDAVGQTLQATEENNKIQVDKYICVIVTDGWENSSREWNKDMLQKAIEERLQRGNWTFTYLGTQPETWLDANAMGIAAGSTMSYTPSMASASYGYVGQSVNRLSADMHVRGTRTMNDYLTDEETAKVGMAKASIKNPYTPPKLDTVEKPKAPKTWR